MPDGYYTLAVWNVQPGREDDFVRLWEQLGHWTVSTRPHARGTLLRDRERPSRFVSFGPWLTLDEIEAWRGDPEFSRIVDEMGHVLESFEPGVYELVREVRL